MTLSPSTSTPVAHNAVPPPSTGRSPRISAHSHIKGLGLTPEGFAAIDGAGFIGQTNAREVHLLTFTTYLLPKTFAAGLWCGCWPHKITKILWTRLVAGWCAWNRKNCAGSRYITWIGCQGAILSHGWVRSLQCRSQKDRSARRGV